MIKVIPIIAIIIATQYNSCTQPGVAEQVKTNSTKTEAICIEKGGVPIYQVDTLDTQAFSTITGCNFPPIINIKAEK